MDIPLVLTSNEHDSFLVNVFENDTFEDFLKKLKIDFKVNMENVSVSFPQATLKVQENDLNFSVRNANAVCEVLKYCRLCGANETDKMVDILTSENVAQNIEKYLSLKVARDDPLSKIICISCYEKLNYCRKFIDGCHKTEQDCYLLLKGDQESASEVEQSSLKEKQKIFDFHNYAFPMKSSSIYCDDCKMIIDESNFQEHFSYHLTGVSKYCFFCKQYFVDNSLLLHHTEIHTCKSCRTFVASQEGHSCTLQNETEAKETSLRTRKNQGLLHPCKYCKKSFRHPLRLDVHHRFHSNKRGAKCTDCDKVFQSEVSFYQHIVYNHVNSKIFICGVCGKKFRNKSSLTYHSRSHVSLEAMKPYTCEICKKSFARKNILRDHIMSIHSSKFQPNAVQCFQCMSCQECFPNSYSAISHMEIHHTEELSQESGYSFNMISVNQLYICELCEKCYASPTIATKHRHTHTKDYQCKMCNVEVKSYIDLQQHVAQHAADGIKDYREDFSVKILYICQFCEQCFLKYQAYTIHREFHLAANAVRPYQCPFCFQSFDLHENMLEHRLSHNNKERVFVTNSNLPHTCTYCSRAFTNVSSLSKHVRIHTGEKPYKCTVCGKAFTQSSGLYTHQKFHSDERPYQCDLCNRSFKIIGDYRSHIRKHSNQRPFCCDVCNKSFKTLPVFKEHRKTHTNSGSFKCDICSSTFRRNATLKKHKLWHEGRDGFKCEACNKSYLYQDGLDRHYKKKHLCKNPGSITSSTSKLI